MNEEPTLWVLTRTFAAMSLIAIGGANAVVPEIHRVAVGAGWMDEPTFANLFAISQAAPGPNVLIVSLVGWQTGGAAGLVAATLAMLVPSCILAFFIGRLVGRVSKSRTYRVAEAALVPVAIGLVGASGLVMARAAAVNSVAILITIGAAALVFFTKRNPVWAILVGAAAGGVIGL